MPDDPTDTQAQSMLAGKPESEGLANTPQETATSELKLQDGPMDRPGTETAEKAAPEPPIDGNRGM